MSDIPLDSPMEDVTAIDLELSNELIAGRWCLVKSLAEGGFGATYEAYDKLTDDMCAIKLEFANRTNMVTKMEAAVLKRLRGKSSHVCAFLGCGRLTGYMHYVVMTLVGKNLAELRNERADLRFKGETVARLAIQCITCIQDVHAVDFLHRDIKPANFAMGRTDADRRNVYLLDFGLARCYRDSQTGGVRSAREFAPFRGTLRYASPTAHANSDLGRHDDLWSLLYVLIEFRRGELPWRTLTEERAVARVKCTMSREELLEGMEPEYADLYEQLRRLQYDQEPDYDWFRQQFVHIQARENYATDGPFEWEEGEHETDEEKEKPKENDVLDNENDEQQPAPPKCIIID